MAVIVSLSNLGKPGDNGATPALDNMRQGISHRGSKRLLWIPIEPYCIPIGETLKNTYLVEWVHISDAPSEGPIAIKAFMMKSHGAQDIGSNETKEEKNNFKNGERRGKPGEPRAEDIPVHMRSMSYNDATSALYMNFTQTAKKRFSGTPFVDDVEVSRTVL